MKVFVVLWDNYGDQGTDFLGTFSSLEKATKFVDNKLVELGKEYKTLNPEDERQYFRIVESPVL